MIKNFFLIAFRNIGRHKVFTFINISGLAVGLAASLLILLWIQDELSFERFNENAENIYRVEEDQFYSGKRYHVTVTPYPSGPVWKERIPEIKEQVRIDRLPRMLFRKDDKAFFETPVIAADSSLFDVFTLPFLAGDSDNALDNPNSIVLTETLAKKYFGEENPLGNTLVLENKYHFTVTGVLRELPRNSMLRFNAVIPFSFLKEMGRISTSWGSNSISTFALLNEGSDAVAVDKKLTDVVLEYSPETTTKYMLFPLLDIHLHSQFGYEENNGPVTALYIFSLIALFIILIACINFINLSTARASSRAREIGIKKVSGADRRTIIRQFVLESLLLVSIAMIFALILVGLLLNVFNNISGKSFELTDLLQIRFIVSFIAVALFSGLLSGLYPALYLSSFKPVTVLKGNTTSGRGNAGIRKILVILQFTLSILIAVSATFMYLQLRYLRDKDLGFDKEDLIIIPMSENIAGRYYSLKSELLSEPLITGVTAALHHPVRMGSNSGGARWDGKDPEKHVLIGFTGVDYDYIETLKMSLVSGRAFSRDFPGDMAHDTTGSFLINEEVQRAMNVGDPVGKKFSFLGVNGTIVGVMKNFHFQGADQTIEPMAFLLADTTFLRNIIIRLDPDRTNEALAVVENVWNRIMPDFPLLYSFVSDDYDDLFRSVMRLTQLLKYFTILALIIASLGLYGLSAYSTERRTNEIGIRKVMGADSPDIIYTMMKEFLGLVAISLLIALPAGWIIVTKLLKQFPYRIDINICLFLLIGLSALLIAAITVAFQAFRASRINPAAALKVE